MPPFAAISPDRLARLLGTSRAPFVIDVRERHALDADPWFIPR